MRKNLAKITDVLKKRKGPIKLNVGCGTDYKDGWVNIDNNSDDNIDKLDLDWDLRDPLPFDDNSVDYIFNEHFVEHLTVEESRKILKDLRRVLKPGGVLRTAMPDLEWVVNNYLKLSTKDVRKRFNVDFVETRAEWINISFRWWGHKWLYDWEELERRMEETGFSNVKRCTLNKSKYPQLQGLETRPESLLIAEATK